MTKEEKILQNTVGKENPFRVPEGYFDHLTDGVMAVLPEQTPDDNKIIVMRANVWKRLPLRRIAAAVAAVAVVGSATLYVATGHKKKVQVVNTASVPEETEQSSGAGYGTFDEVADYVMMDNQDFYASLVAEN